MHENILVGQPIPAGTGIVGFIDSPESSTESIDYQDTTISPKFEPESFEVKSSQMKSP